MTSDESDAITSYNLDDDHDDELPRRSYWWSLHRPETYAITALALAVCTLLSLGPAQELLQSIILHLSGQNSERTVLYTFSGVRLGVALLALFSAGLSIRSEDDDSSWSPPVARAAILVAVVSALLSATSLILNATASDPNSNTGF